MTAKEWLKANGYDTSILEQGYTDLMEAYAEARNRELVEALYNIDSALGGEWPAVGLARKRIAAALAKNGGRKETCANCGKAYEKHLLHDGNKCEQGSINGWFPASIAKALAKNGGGQ